jgi:hypothetical protein
MKKNKALIEAKRKAKKKLRRKMEDAARMAPEICVSCGLPLPERQKFKHQACY